MDELAKYDRSTRVRLRFTWTMERVFCDECGTYVGDGDVKEDIHVPIRLHRELPSHEKATVYITTEQEP